MANSSAAPLTGAWDLVSFEVHTADGRVERPFGERPTGLGIYTPQGLVSAQLMAGTGSGSAEPEPSQNASAPLPRFIAYAGRYLLDLDSRTVEHHVECSFDPSWVGLVLRRSYDLDGNLLTLRPPTQAEGQPVLTWRRREPFPLQQPAPPARFP
ncbi:lipocalin-like domain-containing protein [Streptomyces kunmingensis]|uniref:Lipocalin-like domain-containing protein n=1 Tax=Streptomyces kunmingensis TaxID=68225 RepID=A0ABU6C2I8_9ACTN|nr:lipocalin-like domain-containing protein [Streptomyces kunmingensis]MEB3958854.1 lipocalin-like domain-containing protein [Streptomyces kunmingensis]